MTNNKDYLKNNFKAFLDHGNLFYQETGHNMFVKKNVIPYNRSVKKITKLLTKIGKESGWFYVLDKQAPVTILYSITPYFPLQSQKLIEDLIQLIDVNIIFLDNTDIFFVNESINYAEIIRKQQRDTSDVFHMFNFMNTKRILCSSSGSAGMWIDCCQNNELFNEHIFYTPLLKISLDNISESLSKIISGIKAYKENIIELSDIYKFWSNMEINRDSFVPKFWIFKNVPLLKELFANFEKNSYEKSLENIKNKYIILSKEDSFIKPENCLIGMFEQGRIYEIDGGHLAYKNIPFVKDRFIRIIKTICNR